MPLWQKISCTLHTSKHKVSLEYVLKDEFLDSPYRKTFCRKIRKQKVCLKYVSFDERSIEILLHSSSRIQGNYKGMA